MRDDKSKTRLAQGNLCAIRSTRQGDRVAVQDAGDPRWRSIPPPALRWLESRLYACGSGRLGSALGRQRLTRAPGRGAERARRTWHDTVTAAPTQIIVSPDWAATTDQHRQSGSLGRGPTPIGALFRYLRPFRASQSACLIVDGDDCRCCRTAISHARQKYPGPWQCVQVFHFTTKKPRSTQPFPSHAVHSSVGLQHVGRNGLIGSWFRCSCFTFSWFGRPASFVAGYTNTASSQGSRAIRFKGILRGNANRELRRCPNSANGE